MVVWGVVAFAVLQVFEPVMHGLHLPEWTLSFVVVVLGLGFPITAALAWVFDLKASGIERTPPVGGEGGGSPATSRPPRGRLLLLLGLGFAAAAPGLVYFFVWPGAGRHPVEYASLLAAMGRSPEAIATLQKAAALDPLSADIPALLSAVYLGTGQLALAEAAASRALELSPENGRAARFLGFALLLDHRIPEARAAFHRSSNAFFVSMGDVMVEHSLGHAAESQRAAVEQHDAGLTYLKYDPLLGGLRGDPRYKALLRKVNLPAD